MTLYFVSIDNYQTKYHRNILNTPKTKGYPSMSSITAQPCVALTVVLYHHASFVASGVPPYVAMEGVTDDSVTFWCWVACFILRFSLFGSFDTWLITSGCIGSQQFGHKIFSLTVNTAKYMLSEAPLVIDDPAHHSKQILHSRSFKYTGNTFTSHTSPGAHHTDSCARHLSIKGLWLE